MSRPCPDLPPIDVRRAYLAWCTPSPWLIALVLAATTVWMLASRSLASPLLAGFGAAAWVAFHSDGPGHAGRAGTPLSLVLIGLAAWTATHPGTGIGLRVLLALTAAAVAVLLGLRLRAITAMAARLQARVDATPMAARWSKLPAAVSTLMLQLLRSAAPLEPHLQRALVLATLAWAANEEALDMEHRR
ncbi:hypothetical protein [uncultured Stenotrophomonas sp.]|uniref:hypothetical protein n=1 Tax=uncultured Stenotrophomonas sp. TaxID=165438 RepID=UPI0025F2CCF6|nr:hypothetical protein [uncultured Stenotrophomonas sp.]